MTERCGKKSKSIARGAKNIPNNNMKPPKGGSNTPICRKGSSI